MKTRNNESLTFLLTPDATTARRLRRLFATEVGSVYVRIGVWQELLQQVNNTYLLPEESAWNEKLHYLLDSHENAFWHESYQVDSLGVAGAVEMGWREILCSQSLDASWPSGHANERISKRLSDLKLLNDIALEYWPADLRTIRRVLEDEYKPSRAIKVVPVNVQGRLDFWQRALIDRLNHDSGESVFDHQTVTDRLEAELSERSGQEGSCLYIAQQDLYRGSGAWKHRDDSVEFINVRDSLESIELCAGVIQNAVENSSRGYPDFGLLLPSDYAHANDLADLFTQWGIPLSGLRSARRERDLGRELIRFALMRFEGPVPSMALKALVTNPLMPWDAEIGLGMADSLESFGFGLKPPYNLPAEQKRLVALLNDATELRTVPDALQLLVASSSADEALEVHRLRAIEAANDAISAIRSGETDWQRLRELCNPSPVTIDQGRDFNQEGVTVWYENEVPWRPVAELLVPEFVDAHCPRKQSLSLVFSPDEWRQLKESGLDITLPSELAEQQKRIFLQQLRQVSSRARFIVPRMKETGEAQGSSPSLTDFALLAGRVEEPEELLLDFESQADRDQIEGLPLADAREAERPRDYAAQDLQLGVNLLARSEKSLDKPKTQSPSNLDLLLVSPLAWLLRQIKAEPSVWEPESFSPMVSGTLAHDVFEHVFEEGTQQPVWEEIQPKIEPAFEEALGSNSPFLSTPGWAIERQNLLGIIERAAQQWCVMLNALDATVVQPEIWLQGHFGDVAIRGQADAVLTLPERGVVVVDFKNSGSDKFARRMDAKLDLQASLYREMLRTGGPTKADTPAAEALKGLELTGVAYFTLRDLKSNSDFQPFNSIGGWRFAGQDVSSEGLRLLEDRFTELRQGYVRAPRAEDVKELAKAGVPDYALRLSPLTESVLEAAEEGAE